MKAEIFAGSVFLGLALLCLGHMGQLVALLPQGWFLMFVAVSACLSYTLLGVLLIWHAIKGRREWLAMQNRRRPARGSRVLGFLRGLVTRQ